MNSARKCRKVLCKQSGISGILRNKCDFQAPRNWIYFTANNTASDFLDLSSEKNTSQLQFQKTKTVSQLKLTCTLRTEVLLCSFVLIEANLMLIRVQRFWSTLEHFPVLSTIHLLAMLIDVAGKHHTNCLHCNLLHGNLLVSISTDSGELLWAAIWLRNHNQESIVPAATAWQGMGVINTQTFRDAIELYMNRPTWPHWPREPQLCCDWLKRAGIWQAKQNDWAVWKIQFDIDKRACFAHKESCHISSRNAFVLHLGPRPSYHAWVSENRRPLWTWRVNSELCTILSSHKALNEGRTAGYICMWVAFVSFMQGTGLHHSHQSVFLCSC